MIRGPATLRYGSQSIGGVVSSTNNRIPDALPCGPFASAQSLAKRQGAAVERRPAGLHDVELRGAVSSVDNGREGGVLLDTGAGNFAFHADAFGRRPTITEFPSYPYLDAASFRSRRSPADSMDGSRTRATRSNGIGRRVVPFHGGFAGIAYTRYDNLYAIPGIDGEEHGTRIDAHQDKLTGKGEYRPPASGIDAVRYWWRLHRLQAQRDRPRRPRRPRDRRHPPDLHQQGPWKAAPKSSLCRSTCVSPQLTTAIGVQGGHQELTAPGDAPDSPINGLFDPNKQLTAWPAIFSTSSSSATRPRRRSPAASNK